MTLKTRIKRLETTPHPAGDWTPDTPGPCTPAMLAAWVRRAPIDHPLLVEAQRMAEEFEAELEAELRKKWGD